MPVKPTSDLLLKALLLIFAYSFICHAQAPQARTRQQFAALMSRVSPEMSREEVEAILGKPDDIRTKYDAAGIRSVETGEIWRYGTNGHLTTATLGSVYIDENGKVQGVCGGAGEPPPAWMFAEEELRSILRILDDTPSYSDGWGYNPRSIIRAVNALQPLGKEKALAAVAEYLRVSPGSFDAHAVDGMFLVLRTLFEIPSPPGHMPIMVVGEPSPMEPEDRTRIPRFPIYIQDDIPFKVPSTNLELNEAWSLIRVEYDFDFYVLAHYRRLDPIAVNIFSLFDIHRRAHRDLQPVIDLERETTLLIGFRAVCDRDVDRRIFDPGVWSRFSVGPYHDSLNAVFSRRGRQYKVILFDSLSIANVDDCRLIDIFHTRIVDLRERAILIGQAVKPYAERIPSRRNGFEFV